MGSIYTPDDFIVPSRILHITRFARSPHSLRSFPPTFKYFSNFNPKWQTYRTRMKHTCHTRRVFYSVMFFENVFSTLWWLFDELVKKDKNTLSRLLRNTHITRITHITLFFINGLSRRGFIRGLCFFCVIWVMCVMLISPPKNHIPDKHVTHTLCSTLWWFMWRVCDKLVFYSVISLCGEFCSPKNVPPFYYKILILFYCLFGGVYSFSFGIGVFWIFSEFLFFRILPNF